MADETVESTIDNGTTTPVEPAATPEPQATPEGEQATLETKVEPTPEENTVPMHRFNDVYGKMKAYERQIQANERPAPEQPANQEQSEPNWEKYEAEGKSVEDFNADYIEFQVKKGIEANKVQETEQASNDSFQERLYKADQKFSQQMHAVRGANPNFENTLTVARNAGIQFTPQIDLAIREASKGGDLFNHLITDHSAAYEIMKLSETSSDAAIMKLGEIMANLPTGNSQPDLNLTKINPPPNPIGPGGNSSSEIDENSSIEDFRAAYPD